MIKVSDGKIGTKELFAIGLLAIGMKATDTTPEILFFAGQNAAWMIPLVSFLFLLLPFLVLLYLMKKHNLGLMELISSLMGKWVGQFIGLLFFLIMFMSISFNSRSYVDNVTTMFYPKTSVSYLLLIGLSTCYFVAKRGFETIGRTARTTFWWINITGVLLIIFVWKEIDWQFLFPIFGPGIGTLLKESYTFTTIYVEVIFLAAFLPFVRSFQDFRNGSFLGWGISVSWISALLAVMVTVFDYPAISYMNYTYQQLTRVANIGSFTHIEAFFLAVWVVASVIHFSIYLYLAAYFFGKMIDIKHFESLILPIMGLTWLVGLIPDNIVHINEFRERLSTMTPIFLLGLPFALLLVDFWKGRRSS